MMENDLRRIADLLDEKLRPIHQRLNGVGTGGRPGGRCGHLSCDKTLSDVNYRSHLAGP